MPQDQLLTIKDLAKRLACSAGHVRQLLLSGTLKGVNMSASNRRYTWRVTEEALAAYLSGAAREAAPSRFRASLT